MRKAYSPGRTAAVFVMLVILVAAYFTALYKLQIIEGAGYYEQSKDSLPETVTVEAARGNIYDRCGRTMVSNRESYNITIDDGKLFSLDDPNAAILGLVKTVRDSGEEYLDDLPITSSPPFEYVKNMSSQNSVQLAAYLDDHDLKPDCSAVELMSYFRSRYGIDNSYSAEEMRIVSGVRYSINMRYSIKTTDYIFVEDADVGLISKLVEYMGGLVNVSTSFVREYETQYAAHLLGYIGLMDQDEIEGYLNAGYSKNAKVGKDGVEYAFEKYLHGVDGTAEVTKTADGTVISTYYTKDPVPGSHVYLTTDLQIQEATERALESGYARLCALRETDKATAAANGEPYINDDVTGLAAVVVDVKTGEPLAIASYPTYSLENLLKDFDKLNADPMTPLFNRALNGLYSPGSTFKPCTAIAALNEKIINTQTVIRDQGVFTKYIDQGYAPECWIYSQLKITHGDEKVTTAIRDSCNYFFYTLSDSLTISNLDKYAKLFGLGEPTGIELPESSGNMANPGNHLKYDVDEWVYGDTLQAGIGQSDSMFTPLQLAEYCATIANGGYRHSASILKSVRSYDYSEKQYENKNEVISRVETADYNWAAVQQGMYLVANDPMGTAFETFYGYKIPVAAKTGTAQLGETKTNNGIFICYAPFDDPKVAVCVVGEHVQAGSRLGGTARAILDSYVAITNAGEVDTRENIMLK